MSGESMIGSAMGGDTAVWLAIIGVSLTTLVTRGGFVLFGARLRLPVIVERALAYAPACALAAIMAPDLAYVRGELVLSPANPRLVAALASAVVFALSRSMVATIVAGMLLYTALRLAL
jgi:branched-subunit amino acid transport protein